MYGARARFWRRQETERLYVCVNEIVDVLFCRFSFPLKVFGNVAICDGFGGYSGLGCVRYDSIMVAML